LIAIMRALPVDASVRALARAMADSALHHPLYLASNLMPRGEALDSVCNLALEELTEDALRELRSLIRRPRHDRRWDG
jgi:hypothetical protein